MVYYLIDRQMKKSYSHFKKRNMTNWLIGRLFPWFTERQRPLSGLFCSLHVATHQREGVRRSHLPLTTGKKPVTSGTSFTSVPSATSQNLKILCLFWYFRHLCPFCNFAKPQNSLPLLVLPSPLSLLTGTDELQYMQFIASLIGTPMMIFDFLIRQLVSRTNREGFSPSKGMEGQ